MKSSCLITRRSGSAREAGYGAFPCSAILSLWLDADDVRIRLPSAPGTIGLEASVLTEVHETTPEVLAESYGS